MRSSLAFTLPAFGEHIAWAPDIPIWLSLVVIVATLGLTTVASLLAGPRGE